MKIQGYEDFFSINEQEIEEEITPSGREKINKLKEGFSTPQEIVKAIEKLGFELRPIGRDRTADYTFFDRESGSIFKSFKTGYVRYNSLPHKNWTGAEVIVRTPITRYTLTDPMDRLAIIFRRALKLRELYGEWSKSKLTSKEFMDNIAPRLTARKFGL